MAAWPANGNTDWNTTMITFLAVEHDTTAGTHKIKWPLSTDNGATFTDTRIFTKYISGTTDSDSSTSVPHSITGVDNILSVTVALFIDNTYLIADYRLSASALNGFQYWWDGTNVTIDDVESAGQGVKYKIKIDFIV